MQFFASVAAICVTLVFMSRGLHAAQEKALSRSKRLIISTKKYLWPGGIVPYTFDSSLPDARRQEYLEKVFPVYEKYSCIRFVKRTATTKDDYNLGHNNYLIFEQTSKCISKIGRSGSGGQRISCCYWKTCLHEIGHVLGLQHEHNSPIRGNFIRIEKGNIIDGVLSAFAMKQNVDTFDMYDSDSIMHYGQKAWSKNGKQTITFLDPDARPLSKFADSKRYYYLFMEINAAYKCTAGCDLNCMNGGYKAFVNDKCGCRCPEGVDSKTQCTSLIQKDVKCGGIIELTDQNPKFLTESPEIRGLEKVATCYWIIKSPENSRILLDFPHFYIREKDDGQCKDEVAVRPYLPGMMGSSHCGTVFEKTVQSDRNILGFSFSQSPSADEVSSFIAKAKFVYESDFCYDVSTGGANYNGKVKFAVNSSPCLHWDSVSHCNHHLFNIKDADKKLDKNFCRNPDGSKRPWCYTKSDGCIRNYCDACNFGMCKDLIGKCKKNVENDPKYCTTNNDASKNCRKTCGLCDGRQRLASISTTFCGAPTLPADAASQTLLSQYNVGDKVAVRCNSNDDYQEITCLSDGRWTPLKYVCGTCRPGWTNHGVTCFKFINDLRKQENAATICSDKCPGCTLLREYQWNHDFIKTLITDNNGGCKSVWLDLMESADDMVYTWSNGKIPDWTNWADETKPSGQGCVGINSQCAWTDKKCDLKHKFVCQYTRSDPVICKDQRSDCGYILKRNPKFCITEKKVFARSYCAKTCNLC